MSRNGRHSDWRARAAAVAAYRSGHGDLCPGWGRAAHLADPPGGRNPLSADHVIPTSLGGPQYPGDYQILCRGCNARKGARVAPPEPMRRSRVW